MLRTGRCNLNTGLKNMFNLTGFKVRNKTKCTVHSKLMKIENYPYFFCFIIRIWIINYEKYFPYEFFQLAKIKKMSANLYICRKDPN